MSKENLNGAPWYPEVFEAQVGVWRVNVSRHLGLAQPKASISLTENPGEIDLVANSLEAFLQEMANGGIKSLAAEHLKKGKNLPPGDLIFSPLFVSRGYHHLDKQKNFVDGDYGFALGFRRPKAKAPVWIAWTSFSSFERLTQLDDYKELSSLANPPLDNAPIIHQLQARKNQESSYRRRLASSLLKKLRWEHLFVALFVEWAQSLRLPAVYILSGSLSEWSELQTHADRARMRYDVTAERCGFKREPNGFYSLYLVYPES